MSTTNKNSGTNKDQGQAGTDKSGKATGNMAKEGRGTDMPKKGTQVDKEKGARMEKNAPSKGARTNENNQQPNKKR